MSDDARKLLLECRGELQVIASYADDPETNTGLRLTARAYSKLIARLDAALAADDGVRVPMYFLVKCVSMFEYGRGVTTDCNVATTYEKLRDEAKAMLAARPDAAPIPAAPSAGVTLTEWEIEAIQRRYANSPAIGPAVHYDVATIRALCDLALDAIRRKP